MPCFILGSLLLFCGPAPAFSPVPAQPARAVFYPDEIEITAEERLKPEELPAGGTGFLLTLPPGVKPDSFLLSIDGVSAGGYYWLDKDARAPLFSRAGRIPASGRAALPENEPSPERRALLEKLIPLDEEVAGKQGTLAAVLARIALWEKSLKHYGERSDNSTLGQPSPADEAARLDEAYARQFPALYLERDRQQRGLEDARARQEKARKALDEFDHKEDFAVAAVPLNLSSGRQAKEATLRYTYVLPGLCTLNYRVGAFPEQGEMVVDQEASLVQHSGFAWTNVEAFVSTLRRDRMLRPANIRSWRIALREKRLPEPSSSVTEMMAEKSVPLAATQSAGDGESKNRRRSLRQFPAERAEEEAFTPTAEERGTFRLWNLGKRRIVHNTPVTLALSSDTYKASFLYTVRPVSNPKGFLTAEPVLDKALELPPGMAQFSVDGAAIGRRMFSFNGDKGEIFFGSDPQVTATMRDLQKSEGEQGFFSKEQTLLWHWQITLKNARAKAVSVVLEDPTPIPADTSIEIKTVSTPKPETVVNAPEHGGATICRWKLTLQPGEPFVVDHKVEVRAPAGKILDPGFRGGYRML